MSTIEQGSRITNSLRQFAKAFPYRSVGPQCPPKRNYTDYTQSQTLHVSHRTVDQWTPETTIPIGRFEGSPLTVPCVVSEVLHAGNVNMEPENHWVVEENGLPVWSM